MINPAIASLFRKKRFATSCPGESTFTRRSSSSAVTVLFASIAHLALSPLIDSDTRVSDRIQNICQQVAK